MNIYGWNLLTQSIAAQAMQMYWNFTSAWYHPFRLLFCANLHATFILTMSLLFAYLQLLFLLREWGRMEFMFFVEW